MSIISRHISHRGPRTYQQKSNVLNLQPEQHDIMYALASCYDVRNSAAKVKKEVRFTVLSFSVCCSLNVFHRLHHYHHSISFHYFSSILKAFHLKFDIAALCILLQS
jgi:hypothetical protein